MDDILMNVLKEKVGEIVNIKYMEQDKVKYIDGVITNKLDNTHVGIFSMSGLSMIPISRIVLITSDKLWWKEYEPEKVYYGDESSISEEFEAITGFPLHSKSR